ncbi:MAG: DUF1800 family protein [Pseudomonadota bacterium]
MAQPPAPRRLLSALSLSLLLTLGACGGGKGDLPADAAGSVPVDGAVAGNAGGTPNAAGGADGADGAVSGAGAPSGSGGAGADAGATNGGASGGVGNAAIGPVPTTMRDAVRLADQATFGPTEALIKTVQASGRKRWLMDQFALSESAFTSGGDGSMHTYMGSGGFCDNKPAACWRDYASSIPLAWDFYRNAVTKQDQLRQRVAFALGQITVVSNISVESTIGMRNYHNMLLKNALGNYRDVLKGVAMSPVMGDYLNGVDNNKTAPNENFPRELLQLFSVGTCLLNPDATLKGGACQPTYDNELVRAYAYALTGWTYPKGGKSAWGCPTNGSNCRYFDGDMVPAPALHDTEQRTLLSGIAVPAGSTAPAALDKVLDSLMAHPNMAPFIGRQLIQMLVTSNPSPAYVSHVAQAFSSGNYDGFGRGARGDMQAALAAVLLDPEARQEHAEPNFGKLREPVQVFAGVVRALNGRTDGQALTYWWGDLLGQHVYRAPSVFNFYPPDYPVAGTRLQGPAFAIHNTSNGLNRLNYVNYLVNWGGTAPDASVPSALGTKVDLTPYEADAADAAALVDRLSQLALGQNLPPLPRAKTIEAVNAYTKNSAGDKWLTLRVKTAAYLVFASPHYHVMR